MRTSILASSVIAFAALVGPITAQESRPSTNPASPADVLGLLQGHWRSRAVAQPGGGTFSFRDYLVNEVLPGGRWFVSFSGGDGPTDTSWAFQAVELIPETSSLSGVIASGVMGDVRLLNGRVQGRNLIVNELSERRTCSVEGNSMTVHHGQVGEDGYAPVEQVEKLVRATRHRGLFEPAKQLPPPKNKLDERLRELAGKWKSGGGKNLLDGTTYGCADEVNTLLPGGWIASVARQAPDTVAITIMGLDPAGHALVGVEVASFQATASLVSGYLEEDRLVTRIAGSETVYRVVGDRMTQTRRAPKFAGGRDMFRFELTKE